MLKFSVYNYSLKIGILLIIVAFIVGFFGNKYQSVAFALAYYQYLYVLVITFAGIQYGMVGGFFTSTLICILHVVGLNVNASYYTNNSAPVHYNFQLVFFTLMGLVSGLSYELVGRQCANLNKSVSELTKKLQAAQQAAQSSSGHSGQEAPAAQPQQVDTSVKYYNYLLKFCRNLAAAKSAEDVYEVLFKSIAIDYAMKEIALFTVAEKGRLLVGTLKKNLAHIEKIEEININFGEGIIGKAAVNQQLILNDVSDKTVDWQLAIPLTVHSSLHAVIGVAKCRTIGLITTEDTQYISKLAEISSAAIESYIPKESAKDQSKEKS
ncbi:MAG: hypothetical protein A2008_13035 [Candidatus Wallbacteria bacterium GWC2_49_35]|uniref:GAF domain-containing protein n=1 Tax=Candidatus Wallbacteria bacterium GWC2_49_35 TaxID=1817813 RepID=A0A1F7WKX5_9BACT|nr:MAG: hypothetical protein A2008_13035 [Candidatus Wallbacteria bacterium GWC2_49_35]HBC73415.1 hypothetical protein [Candidatus Wallbacteria bacterium]